MRKSILFLSVFITVSLSAQQVCDWETAYVKADEFLARMTVEEKAEIVRGGKDKFFINSFPDKGIKPVYMCDASMGVLLWSHTPDPALRKQLDSSTAFPAAILLASTFSPELAYGYAEAVGEECRAGGVDILLGPGLNIYRQSQCARNFEYLGEDPYLTSELVSSYVKGLQSTGTAACIKHFFGNNTEFYRKRSNSIIDERAIHEIYLPGFKAGIDAGAACVMTSYNQINGEWVSHSPQIIKGLLRSHLGFKGMVISDWNSVWDLDKMLRSGINIEMPGTYDFGTTIMELYRKGMVSEAELDDMVRPLIATCIAMGFYDREKQDFSLLDRFPEHDRLARKVAEEGTVLLKNRDGILPLDPASDRKILLTGKFCHQTARGLGASYVEGYGNVSLADAVTEVFGDCVHYSENPTADEIEAADIVLLSTGTIDEEAVERPFELPEEDESFIEFVTGHNPNTVVIVNSGSGIRMTGWNDDAAAIIYGWYGGQNGNDAIADILCGKVNPSGKLPVTIEKEFRDSPAYGYLPRHAQFYRELRNELLIDVYDIRYEESVLVGYRWYDTMGIEPLYPFGYGLSYTDFSLSAPELSSGRLSEDSSVKISVKVKNTGKRAGAEVVQLYAGEDKPTVLRPVKELKGFRKVWLEPGETRTVEFELKAADLAFWDDVTHGWKTNPGVYTLSLGTSSRDISHTLKVRL